MFQKPFTSAKSISDHDTYDLLCMFKHTNPHTITCRNFTKYDPILLIQDLANTDFSPLCKITDVNKDFMHKPNPKSKKQLPPEPFS